VEEVELCNGDNLCSYRIRAKRNVYIIFVGKPERIRPLERPRRRWEDNIRPDPRETGWEGVG
jgi:hypothetical protein